jgi:hypothetical protein
MQKTSPILLFSHTVHAVWEGAEVVRELPVFGLSYLSGIQLEVNTF